MTPRESEPSTGDATVVSISTTARKRPRSRSTSSSGPTARKPSQVSKKVQQAKVIALILQGATPRQIEEATGVKRGSIYLWRRDDPEFQQMLNDAESRVEEAVIEAGVASALQSIKDLGPRAAEVIAEALEHKDTKIRLSAASMVLRHGAGERQVQAQGVERFLTKVGDPPVSAGD